MIGLTPSAKVFQWFNYVFLSLLSILMLVPFLHILAGSFSNANALTQGRVTILPVNFSLENYHAVLQDPTVWRAFGVTVFVTLSGTLLNLALTCVMAYPLSKTDLRGRQIIMLYILFTMIFHAPLVPSYLVVKALGLVNTIWALLLPNAISAMYLIIMITFFRNIPEGLIDSAKIDGCSEYRILWSIVLPLSGPALATIGLFYAVIQWNGYFQAIMYLNDPTLYTLQVKLRQLIVENDTQQMMQRAFLTMRSMEGLKMASIMVATLPILFVYPFIQKHFMKGALLGSIKG